jgi:hypothetical protein
MQGTGAEIVEAEDILESLPLAVLAVDRTATLSYTNPAARRLLKGRLNYAVGGGLLVTALGARRAGTTEDYPRENLPLRRALRGQEVALDDLEVQTEDGATLVLEVLASPLRADDGSITGAVATFRDAGPGTEAARQCHLLAAIVGSTDDSVGRVAGRVDEPGAVRTAHLTRGAPVAPGRHDGHGRRELVPGAHARGTRGRCGLDRP